MAATEAAATDAPKKAFRILRLNGYHERPKILFDLPREVRDNIWSYALAEPILYNRRHRPGCAFHNHAAAFQVPPALLHYQPNRVVRQPLGTHVEDLKRCNSLCVRRQGFSLLKGVNKQIQHEASKVFWENNTVCFPEGVSNHLPQNLMSVLQRIPRSALQHIRKLALWQVEDYGGVGTYQYAEAKIMDVLQTMPNLSHIELPTCLLDSSQKDKIFHLQKLQTFRTYALRSFEVTNGNDFVPVYIAVGQKWRLPSCRFKRPVTGGGVNLQPQPLAHWCLACQTTRSDILAFIKDLRSYRRRWYEWTEHAVLKLAHLEPAQPGEAPYVLNARLSPGEDKQEMQVWGLPVHTPATRALEARKAAKRENLANLTRKVPTALVFEEPGFDDDGDFAVTALRRVGRQRRAVEKRVNHEKLLEDRGNRAKNVAKAEAVKGRKDAAKSDQERRMAEEEVRSERRAAAKRAGRRDS